ncbi:MAG: rRNA (cytidine1402-2-O)-methyltransferase [Actinomycetota bacterium]|jgi:16S rRNA (cytidine1402-2'-O)-methyltransferase|nr:rRNA (cytidine1402-2-O)-methyltransferase [Actinomycetota bacterium]
MLVATPIGNLGDLSPRSRASLAEADVIGCEDTRRTRQLLTACAITGKRLISVHEHNEQARAIEIVELVRSGRRVALVTDAGMPAISDPGERVVAAVAAAGLRVEAIPGPSAVVMALALSGLATERFTFHGFLPRKGKDRKARVAEVAAASMTGVLYEAPNRVAATLADLAEVCGSDRRVVLARELTKLHEEVWRGDLASAVDHVAAHEPRGEFVIVIAGAPALDREIDDDVILGALADRRDAGLSNRDASAEVAADLGLPKRRVYDLAVSRRPRPAS